MYQTNKRNWFTLAIFFFHQLKLRAENFERVNALPHSDEVS